MSFTIQDKRESVVFGEKHEGAVADLFITYLKFRFDGRAWNKVKLSEQYSVMDYEILRDGSLFCYIEVKIREIPFNKYPHTIISKIKVDYALLVKQEKDIRCYYVAYFIPSKRVACWDLTRPPAKTISIARSDREEEGKKDHCLFCIDRTEFKGSLKQCIFGGCQ